MEKLISKETELELTKLGLYQLVGGILGLLIVLWSIFKSPLLTGPTVLVFLLVLLLFAYSIFCGTICLRANKNALEYSLVNQMLQLISFAFMGFAFRYISGFYCTIGLDLTDKIKFDFGAGISNLVININNEKDKLSVDLNIVAFALIYWIDKLMSKVKHETITRQSLNTDNF